MTDPDYFFKSNPKYSERNYLDEEKVSETESNFTKKSKEFLNDD